MDAWCGILCRARSSGPGVKTTTWISTVLSEKRRIQNEILAQFIQNHMST